MIFFAKGGFTYDFLRTFWDYLDWHEISTYTLINKHHISSSTINRLRHNKPISTETIDKLCKVLECDIYDIIEYTKNEKKL